MFVGDALHTSSNGTVNLTAKLYVNDYDIATHGVKVTAVGNPVKSHKAAGVPSMVLVWKETSLLGPFPAATPLSALQPRS